MTMISGGIILTLLLVLAVKLPSNRNNALYCRSDINEM